MQDYPVFKRLGGMSEPVVNKSKEVMKRNPYSFRSKLLLSL